MSKQYNLIWDCAYFCEKNNLSVDKCLELTWNILNTAQQNEFEYDTKDVNSYEIAVNKEKLWFKSIIEEMYDRLKNYRSDIIIYNVKGNR